jgi:hypothetical protein
MKKTVFTVEILETWVKKVKIVAGSRGEALAKAKADYVDEKQTADEKFIAQDPDSECRSVDFQLEWPEGNPKEVN